MAAMPKHGLFCPHCDGGDSNVIDSRDTSDGRRRVRKCSCGQRYSTLEIVVRKSTRAGGRNLRQDLNQKIAVQALEEMAKKDKCKHEKAVCDHGSYHLCLVRCECGKTWSGDPSRINTPHWVRSANQRYLSNARSNTKS